MHFKTAVILCALYLLTSARSIGLNSTQLCEIIDLYENHKMSAGRIAEEKITQLMENFFGIQESKKLFDRDSNGNNAVDLKMLLLTLAYKDKKTHDCFQTQMLTPFEVEFFLSVFTEHANSSNQDGRLSLQQLPGVLEDFKLDDTEIDKVVKKLKVDKKKRIFSKAGYTMSKFLNLNSIKAQFVINEADFLLIMLEIKPEGYGLDLQQIEKFVDLYNNCPKRIPVVLILWKFKKSSKSLEHMDEQGIMDTFIVQGFLRDFVSYDKDSDGFLTHEEFSSWVELARRDMFDKPKGGHPQNFDGRSTKKQEEIEQTIESDDDKQA
ncbi:uncharacterized protein LOC126835619 [Adelges cooleyi]|uniref:uncharacterized protein LOC126835619 n=1 Tax=Adelges cooleyi TaxID=133065 RepID=UPI00217F4F99|nr:uncharacterized protein LOC126835619 [Adelges cooleyi]